MVEKYFVHYKDDGPSGVCGQSMSITMPWDKLYLIKVDENGLSLEMIIAKLKTNGRRKAARIEGIWSANQETEDLSGFEIFKEINL